MRFSEKIIIPLVIISLITAVACYYILEEYNDKQFEIKKGITSEGDGASEEMIVTDEELKCQGVAILTGKDVHSNILTFTSTDSDKKLELFYDASTDFLGKYGKSMALEQIPLGEILDVTYSVHSNVIEVMQVSDKAWSYSDVTRFNINEKARTMDIADSKYRMESSVIVSYGDRLANLFDVTNVDTLTVKGIDKKVLSIIVDKGHGYLRLKNETYFVGGWLEVGQQIIKTVEEGMLLPVPEGEYHIRVTNRGYEGDEDVEIERDKETIVDLSKIEITELAIGHIQFEILPDFAQLYVDGQMTEFDERVALEYGVHSIRVESPGYETVNTNIKVDTEFADISISLDKDSDSGDSSSSSSTQSSASTLPATTQVTTSFRSTTETMFTTKSSTVTTVIYVNKSSSSSSSSTTGNTSNSSSSSSSSSSSDSTSSSSSSTAVDTSSSSTSSSTAADTSSSSSMDTSSSSSEIMPTDSSSSTTDTGSSSTEGVPTSSSSEPTEVIGQTRKLYIEAPEGAEAYIDGSYVGIIPTACNKPIGTHIIVIYRNGYSPRSYTVDIANDDNDQTLSFSDLVKE